MFHRRCRRSSGETRAVRHNAKVFGDVITMDHLSSDGDVGMSLSGNTTALIVRDVATGWLDGYPAGSKCTEEVVQALQHFVFPTEKVGMVATDDALEYMWLASSSATDTECLRQAGHKQTELLNDQFEKPSKAFEP